MAAALARHDGLLRDVVSAGGGAVFKTTGDGGCAVFASSAEALGSPGALQYHLAAVDFGGVDGLNLRIGLHCWPAGFRDGDYFGLTLSRCARIMRGELDATRTQELTDEMLAAGLPLWPPANSFRRIFT